MDVLLINGVNIVDVTKFKEQMMIEFKTTDLGKLTYFLGMEFVKTKKCLVKHQRSCALDVLQRLNMFKCNLTPTLIETNFKLEKDTNQELVTPTLLNKSQDRLGIYVTIDHISYMQLEPLVGS